MAVFFQSLVCRVRRIFPVALLAFTVAVALVVAGCAGGRQASQSAPQEPLTRLSSDLLFDILLAGMAAQRGVAGIELDALSRAAAKSRDPRLLAHAAYTALQAGDYQRALADGRRWQRQQPDKAAPHELLGHVLLLLKRPVEAEEAFDALLRQAPSGEREQRLRRVVAILSETGITRQAFKMYRRLVADYSHSAAAHYGTAYFAIRLNDEALAERSMKRALRRRPDWSEAALTWMEFLRSRSRVDDAIVFADAFVRRNRGDMQFAMNYARFLQVHNRQLAALEQYNRVVKREPDNVRAHYAAGAINLDIGRAAAAREHLQRVLVLDTERDDARYHLADLEYESGHFEEAERYALLVTDPSYYFDARFLLGAIIAGRSGADAGLSFLRAMRVGGDSRVRWYISQGRILNGEERYREARDLLTRALGEFPDDGDLLYARALAAAYLGQVELLERDLRKLISQEPNNPHAYNTFGYTLADITDRYNEALALIEKAVSLRGDNPYILDSMGWVQYRLGNMEAAIGFLQRALDISPDAEIAAHLGEVLWVSGRPRRARALWRRMLKLHPDHRVLRRTVERFGL